MGIKPSSSETITQAAAALREGALVAFPTETVYGLGADARNGEAVAAIFEAKGRPQFNPLIVHVPNLEAAEKIVEFNETASKLAKTFWPGALTLVLPKKKECGLSDLISAGLETVALRIPSHPVAIELLIKAGCPVAAPSANKSGHVSPTSPEHVLNDLGSQPVIILDAGPTGIGIESTIVGFEGNEAVLLRSGAITAEEIGQAIGKSILRKPGNSTNPRSPGQLESHYAPRTLLRLNATDVDEKEALLAFGPNPPSGACQTINLSEKQNLREAAANLFSSLRELDECSAQTIAVMPIPDRGLGEAINDRLRRAAAPRN